MFVVGFVVTGFGEVCEMLVLFGRTVDVIDSTLGLTIFDRDTAGIT